MMQVVYCSNISPDTVLLTGMKGTKICKLQTECQKDIYPSDLRQLNSDLPPKIDRDSIDHVRLLCCACYASLLAATRVGLLISNAHAFIKSHEAANTAASPSLGLAIKYY
jgi:hypothetical protein